MPDQPATLRRDTIDADPDMATLLAARPHLRMDALDGLLFEGVPLQHIARETGTPVWVTGAGTLRARYRRLAEAMREAGLGARIHYAIKANDHLAVLRVLAAEGAGADVVSGGELMRAVEAGIAPERIVFSGVGKTAEEMRLALRLGIGQLNLESAEELSLLSGIAEAMGAEARVALRVNPDVDALTHAKISTGKAGDKFGIAYADAAALYARAAALPGIVPLGFAVHIGSQIATPAPFRAAFERIAALVARVRESGHAVRMVDCGGGLGISYRDEAEGSPRAFAGAIAATLGGLGLDLAIEPGRWLVGPSGVLLTRVIRVKQDGGAPPFVVLDSAMNDLLRPSLYEAWHGVVPLSAADAAGPAAPAHLVGPVCETGDTLARHRTLPLLTDGAAVAILDTGAYGAVMSSTYNARPLAAQVLVDGERWAVIRPRQPVEALWRDESVPDWIGPASPASPAE
ncbi:diaminopimelate decarboxylase [Acetobacteraceae bacterium KSS8]|uniref:Diaminopimelate decarboxylase n=1 Tax=Endosaccharibacter trunci TaxID=2812733 RepID=A0ABT1W2R7_9PROT|nr:diaminopimelate decarboxylase [Acetobacteraceae bacterium KSS8]